MDLLHEGRYQCICLVSSDSDFTRLASRLRESEIYVVGMGEQKTPTSFRSACDKFLYLDVLMRDVRNFGFYKLTPFIESLKCYDVKSEKNPSNPSLKLVYIRKKK